MSSNQIQNNSRRDLPVIMQDYINLAKKFNKENPADDFETACKLVKLGQEMLEHVPDLVREVVYRRQEMSNFQKVIKEIFKSEHPEHHLQALKFFIQEEEKNK